MKSNLKANLPQEIILSIGMIVKNEEKHLENCLSALKKFMDQVSCELIIVDTGSTDRTKEIALKYTDKVYDFEWIDDFAAARNYGLKMAKGKWFMFLDADEYMDEDCSEMVDFFNLPELVERYNSASYIIRNYVNKVSKKSTDFLGSRLVKLSPGVEFRGAIHEYLPYMLPHGYFSTVFHHYGYMNNDPSYIKKKKERNLPLIMEEYKKNPENLRTIDQIIDSLDDKKEKLNYVNKGLDVIDRPENIPYASTFLTKSMKVYLNLKKYDEALKLSDKFFSVEKNRKSVSVMTAYLILSTVHVQLNEYESAAEDLENYFEAYHDYKDGKLDVLDLRINTIDGCTEYEFNQNRLYYIDCLFKIKEYEKAHEIMQGIDITKMQIPELRSYLANYRELFRQSKNYKQTAELYGKILEMNDEDKTGLVLYMLQEYYMEHEIEREEFVNAMLESGVEGKYIDLMRIVSKQETDDIRNELSDFIKSVDRWDDGYSESIYLAMKYDVDLSDAIANMSHDLLKSHFPVIAGGHSDYAKVATKYCCIDKFSDSIKKLLWMVSALETAVLTSQNLMYEERDELYGKFVAVLSDYVMNIYNPELLNPDDAEVLPQLHRFGYYMTMAVAAHEKGEQIAYIRILKEALRLCEPMKDLVSFYLEEFEKEMKSV
ncbi:MAG: glycosyltransferase [Porcipelethomonas sp.]